LALKNLGALNGFGCADAADRFDTLFILNSSVLNFGHKKAASEEAALRARYLIH
jgi:hypothetical protein